MNRHPEGDPVLYNHQFYSNILKGIFALDIDLAGTFTSLDKPGAKNLSEDLRKICEEKGMKKVDPEYKSKERYILPEAQKKTRIIQTISALKYLNGGAMQTLHHTDVTPKADYSCRSQWRE